jgi:hypothetical protein
MRKLGIRRLLGIAKRTERGREQGISLSATEQEKYLIEKYAPYTMTGRRRQYALLNAVNYLDRVGIDGAIVECGVWRGGNCMMVKEQRDDRFPKRDIYLFDTFCGMTAPSEIDVTQRSGIPASVLLREGHERYQRVLAACAIEDVKANFIQCGLDFEGVKFVAGPVEETLRNEANLPATIALLRLDTDWYESTKAELEILYPRLCPGGVLIVDDYDFWRGSRAAVDEYLGSKGPLLIPIDHESRIAVKQASSL